MRIEIIEHKCDERGRIVPNEIHHGGACLVHNAVRHGAAGRDGEFFVMIGRKRVEGKVLVITAFLSAEEYHAFIKEGNCEELPEAPFGGAKKCKVWEFWQEVYFHSIPPYTLFAHKGKLWIKLDEDHAKPVEDDPEMPPGGWIMESHYGALIPPELAARLKDVAAR